jgi:sulfur transfer protein SufE
MDAHVYSGIATVLVEEVRANVPRQLKHFATEEMQATIPLAVQSNLSGLHFQPPSLYWLGL